MRAAVIPIPISVCISIIVHVYVPVPGADSAHVPEYIASGQNTIDKTGDRGLTFLEDN